MATTSAGGTLTGIWNATTNLQENSTNLSAKYLGISAKAADSDKLDNYDSAAFARKAEAASITGGWTFNSHLTMGSADDIILSSTSDLGFGGGVSTRLFYSGTQIHYDDGGAITAPIACYVLLNGSDAGSTDYPKGAIIGRWN
jgi:hypothetical protein